MLRRIKNNNNVAVTGKNIENNNIEDELQAYI